MSEFARPRAGRVGWLASAALHGAVIALAATVSWRAIPHITFITLPSPQEVALPGLPGGGGRPGRAGGGVAARPLPAPAASPAAVAVAPAPTDSLTTVGPKVVPGGAPVPQLGDGRLWAAPRPALPADVADVLYSGKKPEPADSVVVGRLRAMVDSVNRMIDQEQTEHRLPSWVTDVGGKKFGLDSSGIYVAGVKIPSAVLAALGSALPPGNWGEAMRNRQQAEMSADLLQAARRAATLEEFRKYVREIRQRKQAERDAGRRARGDTLPPPRRDTTGVVP